MKTARIPLASLLSILVVWGIGAGPARAESGSLYPLLKKDVIVGADYWTKQPKMLAAGLGFINILGVPDVDSTDLSLAESSVLAVDGAWELGSHLPVHLHTTAARLHLRQQPLPDRHHVRGRDPLRSRTAGRVLLAGPAQHRRPHRLQGDLERRECRNP